MNQTASKPIEKIQVLDNLTLVKIPGCSFFIGDEADEGSEITLPDFYMSQYVVTQQLWEDIMKEESPARFKGSNRPVEQVSWEDICQAGGFLDKLNAKKEVKALLKNEYAGMQFQLPSEAQWEYAARGGPQWQDGFEFAGSNNIHEVAWYDENSHQETKPVGLKAPNQLGLYDMSGNVWEWCADDWAGDYKKIPKVGNPYITPSTRAPYRVMRGGGCFYFEQHCRCTFRLYFGPADRNGNFGFRLVLCPPV
jgi:formylglycine-generating enzyme